MLLNIVLIWFLMLLHCSLFVFHILFRSSGSRFSTTHYKRVISEPSANYLGKRVEMQYLCLVVVFMHFFVWMNVKCWRADASCLDHNGGCVGPFKRPINWASSPKKYQGPSWAQSRREQRVYCGPARPACYLSCCCCSHVYVFLMVGVLRFFVRNLYFWWISGQLERNAFTYMG